MATQQKIRYGDCDPQGIVFNANYARYWDDAMTDWFDDLEDRGVSLDQLGVDVVTARLEIDFTSAATLRDILETSIAIERIGNTSMTLAVDSTNKSRGVPVATGKIICVFVDKTDLRPVPVPESFREILSGPA